MFIYCDLSYPFLIPQQSSAGSYMKVNCKHELYVGLERARSRCGILLCIGRVQNNKKVFPKFFVVQLYSLREVWNRLFP
jgi:hypothetical protein